MASVLFTRPWNDEGTSYLHAWTELLIQKATKNKHSIIDLAAEKSNRKTFTSHLIKSNPRFVHLNGHGNNDVVTGHEMKPILDDLNAKLTKNKIVYARACSSASNLGPMCVQLGAECYIGYRRPFVVRIDLTKTHSPVNDETAKFTLIPSNTISMALLSGQSAEQAIQKSHQESQKSIAKLLSSEAPDGATHILMTVFSNMHNLTLLGNPKATL